MALLEVRDLKTHFRTDDGIVKAVDGVSFSVEKGKTLGIVGESGSGKSVTCLSIMGLNPKRNTISSGEAIFNGKNLLTMGSNELREIRGDDLAMIFQDPMTSLNPVHRIGHQLVEAVQLHRDVSKKQARARALDLLKAVGIPRPERRIEGRRSRRSGRSPAAKSRPRRSSPRERACVLSHRARLQPGLGRSVERPRDRLVFNRPAIHRRAWNPHSRSNEDEALRRHVNRNYD